MLHYYHEGKDKLLRCGKGVEHVGIELELFPNASWAREFLPKVKVKRDSPALFVPYPSTLPVRSRFAAYLESSLEACGIRSSLFTFEDDSSLQDYTTPNSRWGVEMISRILSLRVAKKLSWGVFFEKLQEDGVVNLGHKSCGLHIHGNPPFRNGDTREVVKEKDIYLSKLWAGLLRLSPEERETFFGRKPNSYCADWEDVDKTHYENEVVGEDEDGDDIWEEIEVTDYLRCDVVFEEQLFRGEGMDYREECRYVPLNLSGKTGEFRMFASPKNGNQLLGALEVVEKLWYPKDFSFSDEPPSYFEKVGESWAKEISEYLRKNTALGIKGWSQV